MAFMVGLDCHCLTKVMIIMTLFRPDIVAAILDDQLPQGISLFDLAVDVPVGWKEQRKRLTCGR